MDDWSTQQRTIGGVDYAYLEGGKGAECPHLAASDFLEFQARLRGTLSAPA